MMSATRMRFQQELQGLHLQIEQMASCADVMLRKAVESLMTANLDLAEQVIAEDDTVDNYDVAIENKCLLLIAKEQPVAADLRIIGTVLKIISDIERIGDYAVDIAKIGRRMVRAGALYHPLVDLPYLTRLSCTMLEDGVRAFINHDLLLAQKVVQDDDVVDEAYKAMREDLTAMLNSSASRGVLILNILFAAKYLERVSDHVVNIAERVYFVEKGVLYRASANAAQADVHV